MGCSALFHLTIWGKTGRQRTKCQPTFTGAQAGLHIFLMIGNLMECFLDVRIYEPAT